MFSSLGAAEMLIVLAMVMVVSMYVGIFLGVRWLFFRRRRKDPT